MRNVVAIAVSVVILLVAVTTAAVVQLDRQASAEQQSNLDFFAKDLETNFFRRHSAELSWLIGQPEIQGFLKTGGPPSTSLVLTLAQVCGLLDLDLVSLVNSKGITAASTEAATLGRDVSSSQEFRDALNGRTDYLLFGGSREKPTGLSTSVPVFDQSRFLGMVVFRTAVSRLERLLAANRGVLLFDPEGKVFSSDTSLVRDSAAWVWSGRDRMFFSGQWNHVCRSSLNIVPGFTVVSFQPESWPWGTVLAVNFVWLLLLGIGLSVWHQVQLARIKKAEQTRRHEREVLLANLLEGIAVLDTDGNLLWANPAFHSLVQTRAEDKPQRMSDWWDAPEDGPWREVFEGKRSWMVFESILRGQKGGWTPVLAGLTSADGQYLLSVLDRSESHRSDQLLRQSQKLTVLGQLSGGIAHDLNNMLGVLMGMADLIKLTLEKHDPLQDSVDLMLQTLVRAAGLAEKMLDFARQTPAARIALDLTALLRELQFLARTALPVSVEASFDIPKGPVFVMGDENLLLSAFLNLIINAAEALPDGGLVRVTGRVDNFKFELTVSDEGTGMDAPTLERIFEPFFSTKFEKKGTGLGLSLVRRTIVEHQGNIGVQSAPGKGTAVTVTLPVVAEKSKPRSTQSSV